MHKPQSGVFSVSCLSELWISYSSRDSSPQRDGSLNAVAVSSEGTFWKYLSKLRGIWLLAQTQVPRNSLVNH